MEPSPMALSSAASPPVANLEHGPGAAAVEVSEVIYQYGETHALNGLSFTIARGEIFGLLGPNGGGKTTLFRLISTLVPQQGGTIRLLGEDLRTSTRALRRRFG